MEVKYRKIIEEVGILIGITGIVPIIAIPMGLENYLVSIFSLFIFCLLIVFFHSSYINRKIKSSNLGIALVVIIFLIFFLHYFTYTESPFKEKIEKSNDFLGAKLNQKIENAKESIWFIGQSFHISGPDRNNELVEKVKKGVDIYYIVVDFSDSCLLTKILDDYNKTIVNSNSEMMSSLISIVSLKKECEKITSEYKGKVEVKFLSTIPYYRGYFFDIGTDKKTAYVVPYLNHFASSEVPGYLFEGFDHTSVAYKYYESLKKSWARGTTLSQIHEDRILALHKK